jgi:hypothetical protein
MQTNCPGVTHREGISKCLAPLVLLAVAAGAVVVALAMGIGCDGGQRFAAPAPADSVTIMFSADNEGVLSSCGCAGSPAGGFAKRQTVINDYHRVRPNVVIVDAGDMFHDRPNTIKADYLAKALGRAKYDAVAMGTLDFDLGVDQVRAFAKEYAIPFICANVRDESGKLVLPPHVIRQAGAMKIGIFAVIADQAYGTPPREWRKGLKVESPIDAAQREVKDLAGCNLIIALSNQPLDGTRALAEKVPGISVVVSGHDDTVLKTPIHAGDTMIVGTGAIGRMMGALTVAPASGGPPTITMDMVGLSAKVDEAKWVMDLYWEYVRKAKDGPPPDWGDELPVPDKFQSAEECKSCHEAEYKQWQTTSHSKAFATLRKVGKQDDPECILCHTMGFGRTGGFFTIETTPDLGRVTCQACHVVVSTHGRPGQKGSEKLDPKTNVTSRTCMTCHALIESPNFDYDTYKPKIVHVSPHPAPDAAATPAKKM